MFTTTADGELGQEQHSTTGWQQQGQRVICRSPLTKLDPGEPAGVIINAPLATRGCSKGQMPRPQPPRTQIHKWPLFNLDPATPSRDAPGMSTTTCARIRPCTKMHKKSSTASGHYLIVRGRAQTSQRCTLKRTCAL